ncbi:flagellar biosynthesis protein FliR [Algoriphagus iocasae]|uniref:Flagellar biosynthesis protein FliR n=1 Tax=Algoriphagus iocasae TaxID=1836499 RepID=A0A841MNF5_9BACT|nr:hypothetical protein [Algoriphagus iocasae]MBB6327047.1 flagellar biosynthesis protein FliR [Algoriphagus iocasae]
MNSFNAIDPAKNLATTFIVIFQVLAALLICLSIYLIYLSYLNLMTDWKVSVEFSFFHFTPEENEKFLKMLILSLPGVGALITFFVLGYLKKVIQKE